jgi:hypothetical protein
MAKMVTEADIMVHNRSAEKLRYVFYCLLDLFSIQCFYTECLPVITEVESQCKTKA